jgi:hypothetical protein
MSIFQLTTDRRAEMVPPRDLVQQKKLRFLSEKAETGSAEAIQGESGWTFLNSRGWSTG